MKTFSRVFAAAILTLVAGCGGGASPDTGLDEGTEIIRRFVVAFDNGDVQAAMALMADRVVSNDDGLLVGSDAIRSSLEATPSCPVRLGAVETSGDDLLVTIEFLERDGETCPGHTAGSTGVWVFRVEGGKITKIP